MYIVLMFKDFLNHILIDIHKLTTRAVPKLVMGVGWALADGGVGGGSL